MAIVAVLVAPTTASSSAPRRCWRAAAASSSAASGVDLKALQAAIDKCCRRAAMTSSRRWTS